MTGAPDERLQRVLGGDDLAALRKRMRRHFERMDLDRPQASLRLGELSAREHEVLASLMGRPARSARSIQVDIAAIDAALSRSGIAVSLKAALERLDGPIVHLPTERAELSSRWASVVGSARHPDLARLLNAPRGLGLLKRLAKQDPHAADHVRERADSVLQQLPVEGWPRARLAAEVFGDAHGLDRGQPAATLVLATLRLAAQAVFQAPEADLLEEERDRSVWARSGVLVNELARPALFLNIPTRNGTSSAAQAGEPAYASLRSLLRSPPAWAVSGKTVYVCENPNVVAIAADQLGSNCAPLACTDGMPAAAQRMLLIQLAKAGANLVYHGDFDWPGLRIANFVIRSVGARPWRFRHEDYSACHINPLGQRLSGTPVPASWDTLLAPAMQACGLEIPEEAVAATLLQDLTR